MVAKNLKNLKANGTLIWYYYVCKREVWLISHGIEPSQDNDAIEIGRLIHERAYRNKPKEIMVDNKIRIDVLESRKLIGEIKKSSRYIKSAKMQLAFYLYYMKVEKGQPLEGELLIPEERKRIKIKLDRNLEGELIEAINDIERIVKLPLPPPPVKIKFCRNCAYREFCWS